MSAQIEGCYVILRDGRRVYISCFSSDAMKQALDLNSPKTGFFCGYVVGPDGVCDLTKHVNVLMNDIDTVED